MKVLLRVLKLVVYVMLYPSYLCNVALFAQDPPRPIEDGFMKVLFWALKLIRCIMLYCSYLICAFFALDSSSPTRQQDIIIMGMLGAPAVFWILSLVFEAIQMLGVREKIFKKLRTIFYILGFLMFPVYYVTIVLFNS